MKKKTLILILLFITFIFAQEWVARYNGPGNGWDKAYAIAVDNNGNVYVTGYSLGQGTSDDYATIKYNSNGQELWVARYNGPGNDFDVATAIAVDNNGNVYVTGYSKGQGTDYDYATIKYNSNGQEEWVERYNGPGNGEDVATAIAVDNNGNVYVTGYSKGQGTYYDYAIIKYNSYGQEEWVERYNGPGNGYDVATAIAVDNNGNVYVTGYSLGQGTSDDYATIKYNSNGQQLWVARYNGPGDTVDVATAIAVDNNGNVYVTGYSYGQGPFSDYATIKYNSNGQQLWVKRYNEPGNREDGATAIAVDNNGNVYVTGYSDRQFTSHDYATIKYNSYGQEEWVKRYNGPGNGYDCATAIAVDNNGNVYVTGYSLGQGTEYDYATIKYNSNGQELWVRRYNGPGNYADVAWAIAVDNNGNVYVTGYSLGQGTFFDYATIKYSAVGIEEKENKPISKSNLPKENLKIYNIIGKEVNSSKNLKPGIYFIETKEKSKRKIVIVK
jgi:uncharacterized delta-60 repeat protein